MRTSIALVVWLAGLALVSPTSAAEDVDKAKTLFNAGAKAYASARYAIAIDSFREAYRTAPRPAILFSLGQAYRRQYAIDNSVDNLKQAIATFRLYLDEVKEGGRRGDASQALSELEVVAATRLPRSSESSSTNPAPVPSVVPVPLETKPKTHLTITSPTAGARVSLDGGKPVDVPLSEDVAPGTHKYKISADGYVEEEREIKVTEGDQFALERELREKPAVLELEAPAGITVAIDGRFVGTTPLPPQELEPGSRFVALGRNGYKSVSNEIELSRGEHEKYKPPFSRTAQRITSYVVFTFSGLCVLGALGAGLNAISYENQATALEKDKLIESELVQFNTHIQDRDNSSTAMSALLGLGSGAGLAGFLLYTFDQPQLALPPPRKDKAPAPAEKGSSIDVAVAPALSPDFAGGVVIGRF